MIIAIDGPAASGKGTLSRGLAAEFFLAHLDTGLLYRSVAARVISLDLDPLDEKAVSEVARAIGKIKATERELREERVGLVASVIAIQKEVRLALLKYQREFSEAPPGSALGAILDGRDIGSVVLPNADVKIFVTASQEARAGRRYRELLARGVPSIRSKVLQEIRERDERDSRRELSPLVPAKDAFLLDTTEMDVGSAFNAAKELVGRVGGAR
ncbi:MAG: cytidylate kinase [Rhodospirillaceae bacterium]|nr:cytidylate kinase [Rhodospirillaceae bacterium]|tara:strand:+ start:1964 stop:2605 length:642 start_codon:yes stop_codon:yes gene_type:complete